MTPTSHPHLTPDPAELCSQLIRFDSTNFGGGVSHGEDDIAAFIAEKLIAAGYQPVIIGPSAQRATVVVRIEGSEPALPGILIHAHTDVVPAEANQWSFDPFAGTIQDGYVYGRGANDMKDMVAMSLATLLSWAATGVRPRRTLTVAFVADEEDQGELGAHWLIDQHPELYEGVALAIGESGAMGELIPSPMIGQPPVRLYPIAAGERGTMQVRLTARGTSGHGSRPNPDNAVVHLIDALHRISHHQWPLTLIPSVRHYIEKTTDALGVVADLSTEEGVQAALTLMGAAGVVAAATVRVTSAPTMLAAGYKVNVVPGDAQASVDIRTLPGTEDEVRRVLAELAGEQVTIEYLSDSPAVQSSIDTEWFIAMAASIIEHDPEAVVVPYCMGGGTDAKAFSRAGIVTYGFTPLGIDPGGRTASGMHGVDEKVPVSSLREGQKMLDRFLRTV